MDLYLQFGYGMMEHCRTLISQWGGGTVILSPRDLNDDQLRTFSGKIHAVGGTTLVDPQFYLPHADHQRLCSHAYWPANYQTGSFWNGTYLNTLLTDIVTLNQELGCQDIILPGLLASEVDDIWLGQQRSILEGAVAMGMAGDHIYATVAIGADAVRDVEQIHSLLEDSRTWPDCGVYLICEHPQGQYLIDDPNWLGNVLDLIAGFRLRGRRVVVGYCNHQMLIAACASANAIASGTWLNVRSFPPDKFSLAVEEQEKRRATWYYCPQALSEYKLSFLGVARRQGVLDQMAPPQSMGSNYANAMFLGGDPTSVGFTESTAFRHYLQCLKVQVDNARLASFDQTLAAQRQMIDDAATFTESLRVSGVRAQTRAFSEDISDASSTALILLESSRSSLLRRLWSTL